MWLYRIFLRTLFSTLDFRSFDQSFEDFGQKKSNASTIDDVTFVIITNLCLFFADIDIF